MNYLITGGAGFIGSNYADRLLKRGESVSIIDNMSRDGSWRNIDWLRERHGDKLWHVIADAKDRYALDHVTHPDVIIHLAAQVAVTDSVIEPRKDFEDNAVGTFNVLESARLSGNKPIVIYASTNKVYGQFDDMPETGIAETFPLDFHSPYGCSKGAGDQYVRDYYRMYDIPTVVFRQSCIYGPRQYGKEAQGWLAWFIIAALEDRLTTIYGDGKQVRDVLFIDDLLDAYDLAITNIDTVKGEVFNVGGGVNNSLSIWEDFGPMLESLIGRELNVDYAEERKGDQQIYISDIRKAQELLGWSPKVGVEEGIEILFNWIKERIE